MDPRPGHEGELLMAHGGCGKPNPAPFVTDCRAGVTHSKVPKFHRSPCDQFHNQLGVSKGFNQPWTAVEGHLLLANTSWAAPQTNSNPGFCFAGWSDSPHPGPNASLLVFKAGTQGSEPPCANFLGVVRTNDGLPSVCQQGLLWLLTEGALVVSQAAASSEDLVQPWRVITDPIKVIDTARNHSEDAFLWRDERGWYHMLYHSYNQGGVGGGVGGHAFARRPEGPWYDSQVRPKSLLMRWCRES